MKDLGSYHDRYLKTDVLMLNNIFKIFKTCLEHYALDSAPLYTSPGFVGKPVSRKPRLA